MAGQTPGKRRFRAIYLLLLIPYAALICVPLYDRALPQLWGIPFFYWFQMLWIPLGALLLVPVYLSENRGRRAP